jgi:hypothetical protein
MIAATYEPDSERKRAERKDRQEEGEEADDVAESKRQDRPCLLANELRSAIKSVLPSQLRTAQNARPHAPIGLYDRDLEPRPIGVARLQPPRKPEGRATAGPFPE